VEDQLLFMGRAEASVHVLGEMLVVVDEQAGDDLA
jgi:hypothetical protein